MVCLASVWNIHRCYLFLETASLLMSGDSGMIMAELDMMLTQEQFSKLYSSPDRQNENRGKGSHRQKRKVYQPAKPWRNNEVPYVLNPWDFSKSRIISTNSRFLHKNLNEGLTFDIHAN